MAKGDATTAIVPKESTLDKLRKAKTTVAQQEEMSFDEIIKTLEEEGQLLDASQLGEGYHLLQGKAEKKRLIGIPLVVIDWVTNPGKFGGFVTIKVVTGVPVIFDGQGYTKFIVNDGSTGIARQIADLQNAAFRGVIRCRKGLRASEDYEVQEVYTDENGEQKKRAVVDPSTGKPILATTFYLDTSL